MRATWDALASAETAVYVGDPARGEDELAGLFGRLGADPRGGVCVEVGCGPGRMTAALAKRFEQVVAVDVSPAMVERARAAVTAPNVRFGVVSGERLDGIEAGVADVLVCYLVLQHLPRRSVVHGLLQEFARALAPSGEAFVQLPVLEPGARPLAWRAARTLAVPLVTRLSGRPDASAAFRGVRLTAGELDEGLRRSGLRVLGRDSRDVFLRLAHGL